MHSVLFHHVESWGITDVYFLSNTKTWVTQVCVTVKDGTSTEITLFSKKQLNMGLPNTNHLQSSDKES
jgi:hypothetical protein